MIIQADYELLELKLEEKREEIAALKKENGALRRENLTKQAEALGLYDGPKEDFDLAHRVEALKETVSSLRSRLSAYEEGIRPEDADKSKRYIYFFGRTPCFAYWDDFSSVWAYDDGIPPYGMKVPTGSRLYPLTQGTEE